jgi:hypothetical protein
MPNGFFSEVRGDEESRMRSTPDNQIVAWRAIPKDREKTSDIFRVTRLGVHKKSLQ